MRELQDKIDAMYADATSAERPMVHRTVTTTEDMDRLSTALVNAWPTLSAALTEMRRKAEALAAAESYLRLIENRCNVPAKPGQVCHENPAEIARDALKEIESALRGQKETT